MDEENFILTMQGIIDMSDDKESLQIAIIPLIKLIADGEARLKAFRDLLVAAQNKLKTL